MSTRRPLAFFILLGTTIALPAAAVGQQVGGDWQLTRQHLGNPGDQLGSCADRTGDLDGDGVDDYIVGAPTANGNTGYAEVYSGATGASLLHLAPSATGDAFGGAVAGVGDITGDGIPDLLVGAPWNSGGFAGFVEAFDGATGALLWHQAGSANGDLFGYSLARLGDLNNDGLEEVVVGARETSFSGYDAGSIYVLDGQTGSVYWRFDAPSAGELLGMAVDGGSDLDGDGYPDIVAGAGRASYGGTGTLEGCVYLLSPKTMTQIGPRMVGDLTIRHFGVSVAFGGDMNGDGVPDVLVGADGFSGGGACKVYLYSGALQGGAWTTLNEWSGSDYFGNKVAGGSDLDGDGVNDVIVGTYPANGYLGEIYCYSGADYSQFLRTLSGAVTGESLGGWVTGIDDVDGDGRDEFLACAPMFSTIHPTAEGTVAVRSYAPWLTVVPDEIQASAGGLVDFHLDYPVSEAGQDYALLLSSSGTGPTNLYGVEVPLTQDALFQRMISGNPPSVLLPDCYGTLDQDGDAAFSLFVAPHLLAPFLGTYWFAAVSYAPPQAARLSSVAVPFEVRQ